MFNSEMSGADDGRLVASLCSSPAHHITYLIPMLTGLIDNHQL